LYREGRYSVIIDGNLLVSCPQNITAACGLDAFTQLLESFLSPTASPLTDAIALSGIAKISQYFRLACGEGATNPQIREEMAYASLCSGMTLANAGLGIVHGFASPLGGLFPIPHGVACGTLMGIANQITLQAMRTREPQNLALAKMAQVGQLFTKETGQSEAYYSDVLVNTIQAWIEDLAIPRLSQYGITSQDFERIIAQTSNRNNPLKLTAEEMLLILENRL
jgi:alcohol dehydrogenase